MNANSFILFALHFYLCILDRTYKIRFSHQYFVFATLQRIWICVQILSETEFCRKFGVNVRNMS